MKIFVYTKDEEVKTFVQESAGRYSLYLNFMALQDYISNMEANLDPNENVVMLLDFDIDEDREKIIAFNTELQANPRTATIFISGKDSLKHIKEHQNRDDSAGAYLFKPLSSEVVDSVIEDLDFSSNEDDDGKMEFDDATVVDLSFKNFDLSEHQDSLNENKNQSDEEPNLELSDDEEDNTLVREIVDSHNESASFGNVTENDTIQNIFDSALGGNEDSGSEKTESDLSLSLDGEEDATIVAPLPSMSLEGGNEANDEETSNDIGELDSLSLSDETSPNFQTPDDLSLAEEIDGDDNDALDFSVGGLSLGEIEEEDNEGEVDNEISESLQNVEEPLEAISPLDEPANDEVDLGFAIPEQETNTEQDVHQDLQVDQHEAESSEPFEEETVAIEAKDESLSDETLGVDMDSLVEQTTSGVAYSAEHLNEGEVKKKEESFEKEDHSNYTFKAIPESEALRYQATIKQLRDEREDLLSQINKFKQDSAVQNQDILGLRSELDEIKIENSIIKKRYHSELEDYSYRLKIAADKKAYAEEKLKYMEKEFRRLENRVRVDVNHTRQREKELEGQLELVKMDSESQVQTRDKKILELKRKIDQLEFNMENASIREQKSREDKVQLEDRLEKIMKTLRGSIEVLEEDVSWTEKEK